MIALKLNDVKNFMSHLLLSDTFDSFSIIDGEIVTFCTFHIDGFFQKEFFDPQKEFPAYCSWKQVREFCFSVIRGKRQPLSFRFILSLSPENTKRLIAQHQLDFLPEQVQGLYLNIRFEHQVLQCVTGTSLKTFSMDKSLDAAWDLTVQKFFTGKGIDFSQTESA